MAAGFKECKTCGKLFFTYAEATVHCPQHLQGRRSPDGLTPSELDAFKHYASGGTAQDYIVPNSLHVLAHNARVKFGLRNFSQIETMAWVIKNRPEFILEDSELGKALGVLLYWAKLGREVDRVLEEWTKGRK